MYINSLFRAFIVLFLFFTLNTFCKGQNSKDLYTVKVSNLEELKEFFTYDPGGDIMISGHRGGMAPGFPENSIEACENTLRHMVSFFEIDPRLTRDSVFVLMHDAQLARTSTGEGLVSDYTYQELQELYLKDRDGKVTPYKIPSLLDMLRWGKGKTVFNFDNKDNGPHTWDLYIKELSEGGSWSEFKNIILSVRSFEEAMYYWENGVDDRMFCAEISNMEQFNKYDRSPIPWDQIMAYIRLTVDGDQINTYKMLHSKGVSIMTSIHPTADRVRSPVDRKAAYMRELLALPDIIETDYPVEFFELPRSKRTLVRMNREWLEFGSDR